MHMKAIEAHLSAAGAPADEHQGAARRRRGGRQRPPRRLHPRQQGDAGRRRRGDQRLADVRPRHPVDLLRPARPGLLPDRRPRQQVRPALGIVWRRGRQPGDGPRAGARPDEGQGRAHQDSRASTTTSCRCATRSAQEFARLPFNETQVPDGARGAEALRRVGLHHARARLGPADLRGQRPALRFHRRGRQDGAAGRGDGQGQHAPGAQPGPAEGGRPVRGPPQEGDAEDSRVTRSPGCTAASRG